MSDKKLKNKLVKLAYDNPELRKDLLPLLKEAKGKTFKCPDCGTKVMEKTEYCVKCKKKVKKESSTKTARLKIEPLGRGYGYSFSIDDFSWKEPDLWKVNEQEIYADSLRDLRKTVDNALPKPLPDRAWKQIKGFIDVGHTAKISFVPEKVNVYS